jgi:hypothetical protein
MGEEIGTYGKPKATGQPGHPRARRRFLTQIATGALGVLALPVVHDATDGLTHGPRTTTRSPGKASTVHSARDRARAMVLSQRLGPDGLPVGSVAGAFIGTEGRTVLVGVAEPPVGVIRVKVTGHTEVWARGRRAEGDVSACRAGDRVNIGTYFAGRMRVATYINVNGLAYWAKVTNVGSGSLTAAPYYGGSAWEPIAVSMSRWSTVYSRDPDVPPVHGRGAAKAMLNPGDSIHMTCLGSSPQPNPKAIWGVTIHQLRGSVQ